MATIAGLKAPVAQPLSTVTLPIDSKFKYKHFSTIIADKIWSFQDDKVQWKQAAYKIFIVASGIYPVAFLADFIIGNFIRLVVLNTYHHFFSKKEVVEIPIVEKQEVQEVEKPIEKEKPIEAKKWSATKKIVVGSCVTVGLIMAAIYAKQAYITQSLTEPFHKAWNLIFSNEKLCKELQDKLAVANKKYEEFKKLLDNPPKGIIPETAKAIQAGHKDAFNEVSDLEYQINNLRCPKLV